MELVKAKKSDFQRLTEFYRSAVERTKDIAVYAKWVYGKHPSDELIMWYINKGAMYFCERDGAVISAAAVMPRQDEDYRDTPWTLSLADDEAGEVHILCVDPSYQGQGIARETMRQIIGLCRSLGKKAVRLDALSCNTPAHRLYESLGFRKMSVRRWYTENVGWTDFFLYELNL